MKIEDLVEGKRYLISGRFKSTYIGKVEDPNGNKGIGFEIEGGHPFIPLEDGTVGFKSASSIEPIEDETSN